MDDTSTEVGFHLYTLWIADDTMRLLKHIAVDDGVSVATIVRQLIEDFVAGRSG